MCRCFVSAAPGIQRVQVPTAGGNGPKLDSDPSHHALARACLLELLLFSSMKAAIPPILEESAGIQHSAHQFKDWRN